MKLSVVVLTQNSQDTLEACLESVKEAAEIIVVDGGSTDKTVSIAKKFTDKIFIHQLTSFADQRNWGAKKASGDWLLFLDSDEKIIPDSFAEIQKVMRQDSVSAWGFKRKNIFFGHWLKHGGYWPDYQNPRLIRVSDFKGVKGTVHEQYLFTGNLGTMVYPLEHFPPRTISANLIKSAAWTKMEAEALFKAGHPSITVLRLIKVMVWEFCYRYFKKLGFLDGYMGFVESAYQAMNKFFVYEQVWELQQK